MRVSLFSVLLLFASPAFGATVLVDEFNDGSLDPAWLITTSGVSSYVLNETGGSLTASSIAPAGGGWADLYLERGLPTLSSDFHVDFDVSWNGNGVQYVFVELIHGSGSGVALAGPYDPWGGGTTGTMYASGRTAVPNELPAAGSAQIDIDRVGSSVTYTWNGTQYHVDNVTLAVSTLRFHFAAHPNSGGLVGTISVDRVQVDDEFGPSPPAVPEPSGFLLALLALTGLTLVRRR